MPRNNLAVSANSPSNASPNHRSLSISYLVPNSNHDLVSIQNLNSATKATRSFILSVNQIIQIIDSLKPMIARIIRNFPEIIHFKTSLNNWLIHLRV